MTLFGKEVSKALIDLGLNKSQLAQILGCSSSFVTNVLNGRKKPPQALLQFLRQQGLLPPNMRAALALDLGALSVEGLALHEIQQLVAAMDHINQQELKP